MKIANRIALRAIALVLLVATAGFAQADTTYLTDQGHTEVRFGWSHAGVSMQHGEFTDASGVLEHANDIESSSVTVIVKTASVASGFEALDKHLRSADFLEVDTYPEMTFSSTEVKKTGEATLDIVGDLTLHGVTKPITLNAEMTFMGEHPLGKAIDYYKGDWIAFRATTEIDHQAFGVGGFSTGPISIEINTELKAK